MDDTQLTSSVERLQALVDALESQEKPESRLKDFNFDLGTHSFYDVFLRDHLDEIMRIVGTFLSGYALAHGLSLLALIWLTTQQLPFIIVAYGIFHMLMRKDAIAKFCGFVIESVDNEL